MRISVLLLILGMTAVTYIPRALPALFSGWDKIDSRITDYLGYIPYAAMGTLIFPGLLQITDNWLPAVAAGLLAVFLAVKKNNMTLTIVVTTAAYILLQLL